MKFKVECPECGSVFDQNQYIIKCPKGCKGLLKSRYSETTLRTVKLPFLWKFFNWLPLQDIEQRVIPQTSAFEIYQSKGLFGLKNLFICRCTQKEGSELSMKTGTFKDIEAEMSFQRLKESDVSEKPFLVCSAGNVANSFIYYSSVFEKKTVIVTPKEAELFSFNIENPFVVLVSFDGDYSGSLELSDKLAKTGYFAVEGGARNIARRDGIATILYEYVLANGSLPQHYFQALGSGPGAISIFEGSQRIIQDGRFGCTVPHIHASQNYPFVPMYEAYCRGSRCISTDFQEEGAIEMIKQVKAGVLTNRFPPYNVKGGVFDVLEKSNGYFYKVTNDELMKAKEIFEKEEGYAIGFASAVTVSSLFQSIIKGNLKKDDAVLLNITGGDKRAIKKKKYIPKNDVLVKEGYNINDVLGQIENASNNK